MNFFHHVCSVSFVLFIHSSSAIAGPAPDWKEFDISQVCPKEYNAYVAQAPERGAKAIEAFKNNYRNLTKDCHDSKEAFNGAMQINRRDTEKLKSTKPQVYELKQCFNNYIEKWCR